MPTLQGPNTKVSLASKNAGPYADAVELIVVPVALFFFLYNPHFADGELSFLESGYHLGNINAIFHGMVPYRDFFCFYGPLSAWLPAWIMAISEPSLAALRGYFHVSDILGTIVAYFVLRTLVRNRVFVIAGLVILVLETHSLFWTTRWGAFRPGIGLLVLLCLFLSEKSRRAEWWMGLAGMCSACAILYSTEVGIASVLAVSVYLYADSRLVSGPSPTIWMKVAPVATGFLLVSSVFVIYGVAQGMLLDYLRITFYEIPFTIAKFCRPCPPGLFPGQHSVMAIADWITGSDAKVWIAALSFLVSLVSVAYFRRVMNDPVKEVHVWALLGYGAPLWLLSLRGPLGPQKSVSLTVAIMLWLIFAEQLWLRAKQLLIDAPRRISPDLGRAVLCILIVAVGMTYWLGSQKQDGLSPGQFLDRLVRQKYISPPDLEKIDCTRMGGARLPTKQATFVKGIIDQLDHRLGPKDSLFVFPDMAFISFLCNRRPIGRFPVPLYAVFTEAYALELLQTIERQPPSWVVYNPRVSEWASYIGYKEEDLMPEIVRFIRESYRAVDTCNGVEIMVYKGRNEQAKAPRTAP